MSNTPFEVLAVKAVEPHPQADRLEIARVLGTQFVTRKGDFQPGDLCVYFPPDMLISENVGEILGVANYLKHSVFPGDLEKSRCRIGAIRLRGVASFGFGIPLGRKDTGLHHFFDTLPAEGTDVTELFGGVKYQPPEQYSRSGDSMRQPEAFHKYTDIQHYYRYAEALIEGMSEDMFEGIPESMLVRICEKIHGTNSRVGWVKDDGFEFMCGTHHRRVKAEDAHGRPSLYWAPLTKSMKDMLTLISCAVDDVIVFGEIYGHKIQQMDYGCQRGKGYRVFDISVNGEYLDWDDVRTYCEIFDIETVSLLYEGPFSAELVDKFVSGPTTMAESKQIKCSFKGREGIVITSLEERYSELLNDRLILKAVSSDYYEAMK